MQVGIDYDKVLEKKKAKLEELKETAKEESKIQEMQDIVDEMISDRENRIDQTLSRLTDSRLRPGSSESSVCAILADSGMKKQAKTPSDISHPEGVFLSHKSVTILSLTKAIFRGLEAVNSSQNP